MNAAEPLPTGDAELVRRYVGGEHDAFARLYDAHDRHCFEFIRRMLGGADAAAAEDLHQETWLAVARQAASYDAAQARFVTWLFTIARHKVMDHFRKASGVVRLAGDLGEAAEAVLDAQPDAPDLEPEQVLQNRQLVGVVDESDLLLKVHADPAHFRDAVAGAMTDSLQTLPPGADLQALRQVLDRGLVAIVADGTGFHGLITRFDLLNHLRRTLQ